MAKAKKKDKNKKKKNSKTFNVFNSMSVASKMEAFKIMDGISNSLSGDIKEGFDSVINGLKEGKDNMLTAKETISAIKDMKDEGIDMSTVAGDGLRDMIDTIGESASALNEKQNEEYLKKISVLHDKIMEMKIAFVELMDLVKEGSACYPSQDDPESSYLQDSMHKLRDTLDGYLTCSDFEFMESELFMPGEIGIEDASKEYKEQNSPWYDLESGTLEFQKEEYLRYTYGTWEDCDDDIEDFVEYIDD